MLYVYLLIDPRDGRPRYVGQTENPARRLEQHRRGEAMRTRAWSRVLRELGVSPIMRIVAEVRDRKASRQLERRWIFACRYNHGPLLNQQILGT